MTVHMNCYIIDPRARTIAPSIIGNDYKEIYKVLSSADDEVRDFNIVRLNDYGDYVYVDGESLVGIKPKNQDPDNYFGIKGYGQPLCGKGMVLGTRGDDSASVRCSYSALRAVVLWPRVRYLGTVTTDSEADHPVLGKLAVINVIPKFEVID